MECPTAHRPRFRRDRLRDDRSGFRHEDGRRARRRARIRRPLRHIAVDVESHPAGGWRARRRHVGTSIQDEWTTSLESVRSALDADVADDRLVLLRAQSQELGSTREAVEETAVQRLDLSQKQAGEAYTLAETFESNPRSVWGYVQGLTRLSQRTPWQDGRFNLDRAASRLLTTVH